MLRHAARMAALALVGIALVGASAHAATSRLIGQPVGAPSSAPFTVLILAASGSATSQCTGSVIDATHVLTAAHCTRNGQGQQWPRGSMIIRIGASDVLGDGLVGPVLGMRVHPAYDPATGQADVAVLLVPPIAMGPTIAAVPLVEPGAAPAAGARVQAFGWGESGPDGAWDGTERMLDLTVGQPTDCWSGVAAVGCASTPSGGPCPGDSGGPILRDGLQVGVTSTRIGVGCAAGGQLGFVDLTAPGIAQFVRGSDSPPPLPLASAPATLTPPPLTGGAATCAAPPWSNAASTTTVFFHRDGGQIVQDGASTSYQPKASDVGHELGCRSVAQAAGGSAIAPAGTGLKVLAATLAVKAGKTAATVSYAGAEGLALSATLTNAKGRKASLGTVPASRRIKLPSRAKGTYQLCVDAPAAGQFASAQACTRWRAPKRG